MKTPPPIQWKRLATESMAIVSSILLAFWIDAWWAERQNRLDERQVLMAIKAEFEDNIAQIEKELKYRHAVDSSIMKILNAGAGTLEIAPEELDRLIGDLTWWSKAEFKTGALESTLLSGKLSLIQSEELRIFLAGIPAEYENVRMMELQDKTTLETKLYPFLFPKISLAQIANTYTVQPGTGENPTPSKYPVNGTVDHRPLLSDREFLNIVTQSRYDHIDAIWGYGGLKEQLNKGIEIISEEIGQ